MAGQQLNLNIILSEVRYLKVPDITHYRLEFIIPKFKTTNPIWRTAIIIIIINRFGWNSVHGDYRGR